MLKNRGDVAEPAGPDSAQASKNNVRFFSHSTHVFSHHIPTEFILLGVIETLALIASFYVGIELRHDTLLWYESLGPLFPSAIAFAAVMVMSLIAFGAYRRQPFHSHSILAVRIGASMIAGMAVLSMVFYIVQDILIARGALAYSILVGFLSILTIRLIFYRISNAYDLRLRTLVLGSGKIAGLIREAEAAGDINEINIISYIPMPGDKSENKGISLATTPGSILTKFVRENNVDVIVLAMDDRRNGLPVHELLDCKMGGIEVIDLLTFFERHTSMIRLDIMQPSWLFLSDGFQVNNFRRLSKRLFDIAAVILLLPYVLPVFLITWLAIMVESGFRGSAFYSQVRVGEKGRLFKIYKLRSMVADAEHDGIARWAEKDDLRITRVGAFLRKFRLDELPQLYNVLKGDMSFVGPRPERPEFVERLSTSTPYYNERLRVKPGLSGWAQIRYPYGASVEDGMKKLQYDLYYVKNYSILLDAVILLQTVEVVLLGRGAH